jgi:hypothetical protein
MIKKIIIKIKKFFSPKITRELQWTVNDFNLAKKWASCRFHPNHENKTIWEIVYSPRQESLDVIYEINKLIKNKIK